MSMSEPSHHHGTHFPQRKWWLVLLYIALVVTLSLALMCYQYARYGSL